MSHESEVFEMTRVRTRVGRSVDQKFQLVMETHGLCKCKLGTFYRYKGVYAEEIKEWKDQMADGLAGNMGMSGPTKRSMEKRIKQLEKELNEAKVIIELQKKVEKILVDAETSTNKRSDEKSSSKSKKLKD